MMTEDERNRVIAECAAVCDERSKRSLNFLAKFKEFDEEGVTVIAGMEASDCAEAIRRLSPDYAARADKFSGKVKVWVRKLMAGENPGPLPINNDS